MMGKYIEVLEELRNEGYAIVVFNPLDLKGLDPGVLENSLTDVGFEIINTYDGVL